MSLRYLAISALAITTLAAAKPDMKPYPEAEADMVRHALVLESRDNEEDFKVELILGKTVETDGANRHFFSGKIESHTVEGWGYSYHKLDKLGPMAGTLMAPAPGAAKVKKFVRIGGNPYWVRYNSKLPVVIYAPKGVEVRYRLWSADGEGEPVPQG